VFYTSFGDACLCFRLLLYISVKNSGIRVVFKPMWFHIPGFSISVISYSLISVTFYCGCSRNVVYVSSNQMNIVSSTIVYFYMNMKFV
jgi:hypothetical protein